MHLQSATPIVQGNQSFVELQITDVPTTAQSIAVRFVTAVTPDNELGFKQVQSYKRTAYWQAGKVLVLKPGGDFPLGIVINIYVQEQTADQTIDVGVPSNALAIIVGPPQ